jgi:hypothetical protein
MGQSDCCLYLSLCVFQHAPGLIHLEILDTLALCIHVILTILFHLSSDSNFVVTPCQNCELFAQVDGSTNRQLSYFHGPLLSSHF